MFDMMKMMGKIKEVQERVKLAQEGLEKLRITGESGAGMVKATVDGKKKLLGLEIDPALSDPAIIRDLIIAAVNKAQEEADVQAKEFIRKSTEGLIPNIPGMDLGSMMG